MQAVGGLHRLLSVVKVSPSPTTLYLVSTVEIQNIFLKLITEHYFNSTAFIFSWIVFCCYTNKVIDILAVYHTVKHNYQIRFLGIIAPSERLGNHKGVSPLAQFEIEFLV